MDQSHLDRVHDTIGEDSHLSRNGLDSLFELSDVRARGKHAVKAWGSSWEEQRSLIRRPVHTSKSVRLVSHCSDSAENTVGHFTSTCSDPWLNNKSGISNFLEVTIYHFTTQPEAASPKSVNAVTWKWGEPRLFEFTPQVHPPKISDFDVRGQAFWRRLREGWGDRMKV